jgi:O-antigen ligase
MMSLNNHTYSYFLILFSLIPLSILIGPAISLANILIIDISFMILLIYKRNFIFLKNNTLFYIIALYIYLIFNTFISIDYSESILRNVGFVRIIILFLAFNYFFNQELFFEKMIKIWMIILSIVILDVFIEFTFGKNLLGYGEEYYGNRIVSFFKDEPIVGGYINGFFLIILGFLLNKNVKYKYFLFIILIIFVVAVIITGERSNSIKVLLGASVFLLANKEIKSKHKIIVLISSFLLILIIILNSSFLKIRFYGQIKSNLDRGSLYFKLYKSGFNVFKNYPIFGVGNKNYRIETCSDKTTLIVKNKNQYICNTHPHQLYLDFLSEHGFFGTIILLFIFYKLIFSKIKKTFIGNNYIQIGSLIFLIFVFAPIIPSGAFFNDYALTIFAINLSIFYASDKKMNIFKHYK